MEPDADYPDDLLRDLTIGFTITGKDELEPNAPSTEKRIEALRKLHDEYKIKTFVSLEPITSIHAASEVIKKTYKITDEIRIGAQSPIKKDRYDPNKFVGFVIAVKTLARGLDCRFMVKDSMYKQAETFEGVYRDLCVRKLDEIKRFMNQNKKKMMKSKLKYYAQVIGVNLLAALVPILAVVLIYALGKLKNIYTHPCVLSQEIYDCCLEATIVVLAGFSVGILLLGWADSWRKAKLFVLKAGENERNVKKKPQKSVLILVFVLPKVE